MLEDVERRLAGFVDFCRDQITAVDNLVKATPSSWSGEAADAYQARQADWVRRAGEVTQHLDEVRQRLTTAHEAYQGALNANLRMFG
ncbi:WXG100 family type VII secretion target [Nocardia cyriacigeorgica]|uniref:WXG100 family type VII secretion target n=2 Tax=Nocardia cyriacigeorgica TaxID=135487 RepID=A0A5R8P5U3_9NOCA|nr:WXG100 family type VII secretion target [Nocardia cyriacigeorgica]